VCLPLLVGALTILGARETPQLLLPAAKRDLVAQTVVRVNWGLKPFRDLGAVAQSLQKGRFG
jgi:hypothetical protein